jgi:hypothetical protein
VRVNDQETGRFTKGEIVSLVWIGEVALFFLLATGKLRKPVENYTRQSKKTDCARSNFRYTVL